MRRDRVYNGDRGRQRMRRPGRILSARRKLAGDDRIDRRPEIGAGGGRAVFDEHRPGHGASAHRKNAAAPRERRFDGVNALRLGDKAGMAKPHAPRDPVMDYAHASDLRPVSPCVTEFSQLILFGNSCT